MHFELGFENCRDCKDIYFEHLKKLFQHFLPLTNFFVEMVAWSHMMDGIIGYFLANMVVHVGRHVIQCRTILYPFPKQRSSNVQYK
jgi:hypothetical protein